MNAVPEGDEISRRERYSYKGLISPFLIMPEVVRGYEYLITLWQEAGAIESDANGIKKLSWQELESWLRVKYSNTRISDNRKSGRRRHKKVLGESPWLLSDWEICTVRQMSEAYVEEYNLAKERHRDCPTEIENFEEINRRSVDTNINSIFGGFAKG